MTTWVFQHHQHQHDEKLDGKIGLFVGVGRTGLGWGHHCGHITSTILIIMVVVMIMIMMSTMIKFISIRNANIVYTDIFVISVTLNQIGNGNNQDDNDNDKVTGPALKADKAKK